MLLEASRNWEVARIWNRNQNDWARDLGTERLTELAQIVEGLPLTIELPLPDGRRIGLVHAELAKGCSWNDVHGVVPDQRDAIDDSAFSAGASLIWGRRRISAWASLSTARNRSRVDAARHVKSWESLQPIDGIDLIIAGHTVLATAKPVAVSNLLFIETGAFMPNGRLTLVEPQPMHYWQTRFVGKASRSLRRTPTPLPKAMVLQAQWRPTQAMLDEAQAARARELDLLGRFWS